MGSRRETDGAGVRLPELSRRAVFVGVTATPILTGDPANAEIDPTIAICERWLAANAEIDRLSAAWRRHEHVLSLEHDWYRLSQAEQDALPEGRALDEISARIDVLDWECDALVKALPTTPAQNTAVVIASLTLAVGLFYPNDQPEVHGMITRAIRDLKALSGVS